MKQLLTFLKATLLGGVIFVLPAWLAVLLVAKALTKLQVLVKPVSTHLPESVGHPRLLAVILLLALCFVIGLIIQTAIGAQVKLIVEQRVLEKLPGYTTLRGFAAQLSEFEKTSNFQPALKLKGSRSSWQRNLWADGAAVHRLCWRPRKTIRHYVPICSEIMISTTSILIRRDMRRRLAHIYAV
jgi:hypothetical protein